MIGYYLPDVAETADRDGFIIPMGVYDRVWSIFQMPIWRLVKGCYGWNNNRGYLGKLFLAVKHIIYMGCHLPYIGNLCPTICAAMERYASSKEQGRETMNDVGCTE
jgi:hypothetical protein